MARWITVTASFDYRWPNRSAITHFSDADLGDHHVKDEVADFAVGNGYAVEGKSDPASRSKKGKRGRAEEQEPEQAAEPGTEPPVDHADHADPARPADRPAVDSDAE